MTQQEKQSIYSKRYALKNPIRSVHADMLRRCGLWGKANPHDLKYYRDRGITVCKEWMRLDAFREWALAHGYKKGLQLDRKDSSKDYSPDNCRFVTRSENMRNRSNNRRFFIAGREYLQCDIPRHFKITVTAFWHRVNVLGWSPEEAALTPIGVRPNGHERKGLSGEKNPASKKVVCKETGEVFGTITEAAKHFGIGSGSISAAIKAKRKVRKQWTFSFQ